jgi:small subunit ribosomal protein S3Ae
MEMIILHKYAYVLICTDDLLQVHIRKVKLLKSPKFDLGALLSLHGESTSDESGQKVEREFKETVLEEV